MGLEELKRIVIKLGTQVVVERSGVTIAKERLTALGVECAALKKAGKEIIIVSSGAIGLGRGALALDGVLTLVQKQACAAVGQGRLMQTYQELFSPHGVVVAQVLVTSSDFSDRSRYLNLRGTFEELLKFGVIPVVNENDTVSAAEIVEQTRSRSFGDNDKLSALVAAKLQADLLLILTNVDGVYDSNPKNNPQAKCLRRISSLNELAEVQTQGNSAMGRGGMVTKLEAAKVASLCGVDTIISSGMVPNAIEDALSGNSGTRIDGRRNLSSREHWISSASGSAGTIVIDERATSALEKRHASLLPVGIKRVEGEFSAGEVVSLQDEAGVELGRGIVNISAERLSSVIGMKTDAAKALLDNPRFEEVIHCDNLILFAEEEA